MSLISEIQAVAAEFTPEKLTQVKSAVGRDVVAAETLVNDFELVAALVPGSTPVVGALKEFLTILQTAEGVVNQL
jgi:hypothetical protein